MLLGLCFSLDLAVSNSFIAVTCKRGEGIQSPNGNSACTLHNDLLSMMTIYSIYISTVESLTSHLKYWFYDRVSTDFILLYLFIKN